MARRTVVTVPSTVAQLTTEQRDRLNQIERLLVNIQDPVIGAHAARVGYDAAEHQLGWSGWAAAAGLNRPFDHYLVGAAASPSGATSATAVRLRLLDQFENTVVPARPHLDPPLRRRRFARRLRGRLLQGHEPAARGPAGGRPGGPSGCGCNGWACCPTTPARTPTSRAGDRPAPAARWRYNQGC